MIDVNRRAGGGAATLPGIGPTLSRRIIEARRGTAVSIGGRPAARPGIGPKTLERCGPSSRVRQANCAVRRGPTERHDLAPRGVHDGSKVRAGQQVPARRRSAAGHREARRRASAKAGPSRRCSAPPAPARPSPPPTSSPSSASRRWCCPTTRRWPPSSTRSSRGFFPRNAVHYFVSYYDYYQPEAYIPQRDIYIEKDALINENIDRLRLAATSALVSREDVIIVASVSCIYGLGSPSDYKRMMVHLAKGEIDRPRQAAPAAWSTSSTSATTSPSSAASSASAAT